MQKTIVVAGATGNLGGKIIRSLLAEGAAVRAVVREQTDASKIKALEMQGVQVFQVNMQNTKEVATVCIGAHCVVSALAGLRETIIDTQKNLLDAAVEAKVPRFIPSDYAIDFTNLVPGQNRNLDLRREFHHHIEKAPIAATSIFNGPFMDLLTTDMPLILKKQQRILCWGNPKQMLEFTTTHNIAEFTAKAALDINTPRYLRIAGDCLNSDDFTKLLTTITGKKYKIFRPGGIGFFNVIIKIAKFFQPGEAELYPAWQGMQYMRDMMEGRVAIGNYDNKRYDGIKWTSVNEFLADNL